MKLPKTIKDNNQELLYIGGYFLFLFVFWSISRLLILPKLEQFLSNTSFTYALSELVLKMLIWVLPVYLILKSQKLNTISFLKLNSHISKGLLYGMSLGIIFLIINIMKVRNINRHISYSDFINTFLVVGIIEEIAFRGYIMQKLKLYMKAIPSNVVTSLMFMSIHIPMSIYTYNVHPLYFIQVGILSFIFGYFFEETDSLICPIIMHSLWDLSMVLIQVT